MSRTRPDQAEDIMLGFTCGRCAALPEEWCLTSRGGPSALLHSARFWQASAVGLFPIELDDRAGSMTGEEGQ